MSFALSWLRVLLWLGILLILPSGTARAFWNPFSQRELGEGKSGQNVIGENAACESLDIVFLVDQSGSMSNPPASDPYQQRKYAVKSMIDLLADLAVDQCRGQTYRVAVVSFGDRARVDLPLSNINPFDYEAAQALREKLSSYLKADDMGQTYPLDAFYEAAKILRNAPVFGEEPRKKVIIFVTDGLPCIRGGMYDSIFLDENLTCMGLGYTDRAAKDIATVVSEIFPFHPEVLRFERCFDDLRSRYGAEPPANETSRCLAILPEDKKKEYYSASTYLYLLLLRGPQSNYTANLLKTWENLAETHGGQLVELGNSPSELPGQMRMILSELTGVRPNLLECGNPFAVNPYLKRLRITVYNISEENKIVLSYVDAEGKRHQIQKGVGEGFELAEPYYSYGVNERYVFAYPYPGLWQVSAESCEGVDIYAEAITLTDLMPFRPNLPERLPSYDIDPYYSEDEPYYVKYQLMVGDRIIEQSPKRLFALNAELQVVQPDGNTYTIPMEYNAAEKMLVAKEPLRVPVAGNYKLTIRATTRWHSTSGYSIRDFVVPPEQSEEQAFPDTHELFSFNSEFNVFAVNPFVLQAVQPVENQTIRPIHYSLLHGWPLKVRPLEVRVRLVTRDGKPLVDWENVFKDNERGITAFLTADGERSQIISLSPLPGAPGEFVGEIPDFGKSGPQTVTFQVNRENLQETYRPDRAILEVRFQRQDTLWTSSSTYFFMLWMFVLFAVGLVIYNISIRTNPVTGSLEFVDGDVTLAEFNLYNGKNFRIISKELRQYPQFGLKRIKAYNTEKRSRRKAGGRSLESSEFPGSLEIQPEPQSVRLECVSKDGRRFTVDLFPDSPVAYSDSGVGMMRYKPLVHDK